MPSVAAPRTDTPWTEFLAWLTGHLLPWLGEIAPATAASTAAAIFVVWWQSSSESRRMHRQLAAERLRRHDEALTAAALQVSSARSDAYEGLLATACAMHRHKGPIICEAQMDELRRSLAAVYLWGTPAAVRAAEKLLEHHESTRGGGSDELLTAFATAARQDLLSDEVQLIPKGWLHQDNSDLRPSPSMWELWNGNSDAS